MSNIPSIIAAIGLLFGPAAARDVPLPRGTELSGRVSVIDGDTLDLHARRIRLLGIDAPESSQLCTDPSGRPWRCGAAAANRLSDFIASRPVTCRVTSTDRYGRSIARCAVAGQDLGRWAVTNGWALAYRRYAPDYIPDEQAARTGKRGIHAGQFQAPWDYRASKRNR